LQSLRTKTFNVLTQGKQPPDDLVGVTEQRGAFEVFPLVDELGACNVSNASLCPVIGDVLDLLLCCLAQVRGELVTYFQYQ